MGSVSCEVEKWGAGEEERGGEAQELGGADWSW